MNRKLNIIYAARTGGAQGDNYMEHKARTKALSWLLSLAMVLSLMPGMSLTALAADNSPITVTWSSTGFVDADFDGDGKCYGKDGVSLSGTYIYNSDGEEMIIFPGGSSFTTTIGNFTKIEVSGGELQQGFTGTGWSGGRTWTGNTSSVAFNLNGFLTDSEHSNPWTITFTIDPVYKSVTIRPGNNMTKTTGSGAASQTDLAVAMTDVVYTANNGYYFPKDYSVVAVNGITVTRNSYTQITVSGMPTADAEITLTAPIPTPAPAAPTKATETLAPTITDGKITATQVLHYAGKEWYVIASGDKGVQIASDAVTRQEGETTIVLLARELWGSGVYGSSGDYNNSTLKTTIEGFVTSEKIGSYYTDDDAWQNDLIAKRTLAGGGAFWNDRGNYAKDNIMGDPITDATLWPLSGAEALQMFNFSTSRDTYTDAFGNVFGWFLRNPGRDSGNFPCTVVWNNVESWTSDWFLRAKMPSDTFGVRPALCLNLTDNILASETFGGSGEYTLIPPHQHAFTYTPNGATITATCADNDSNRPCPLTNKQATLTIAAPTEGNDATITVSPEGAITGYTVVYQSKNGSTWGGETTTAPTAAGIHKASITLTGTDNNPATASVTYGNNCITYASGLVNGSIDGNRGATCGATITPTISPVEGYELDALTVTPEEGSGVSASDITVNGGTFVMPEANVTVSATFKKINSAITLSQPAGGTVTAKKDNADVASADYGDTITLGNTPAAGYSFISYSVTKTGDSSTSVTVSDGTFTMPAYPVTVTGTFTLIDYTVAVDSNIEHGTVTPDKISGVHIGDVVTLTVNPTTGYEIDTLTVTKEGGGDVTVEDNKFTMPEANVTVSATFKKINSAITLSQPAGGTVTAKKDNADVASADYGDTITLGNTPAAGFNFVSYKVTKTDDENTTIDASSGSFTMPEYPVTVTATFEGQPFAVTTVSDPTSGGTVSVTGDGVTTSDGIKAKTGTEVTLTATPATGFTFGSLAVKTASNKDVTVTNGKFTMPAEAVTVTATFTGHDTTATLNVIGGTETTRTAKLLNESYQEINSVTKTGGEEFILLINRDTDYDFDVTYDTDSTVSMREFTTAEYDAYATYAKENNLPVSSDMVLARVTMPGVVDNNVTLTVTFSKVQPFTILYKTNETNAVWCKFAYTEAGSLVTDSAQMKSDTVMGDGTKVYSLKVMAAFNPDKIAFATSKSALENAAWNEISQTNTWVNLAGDQYNIVCGNAKTAIAAFVTDSDAVTVYDSDEVTVDRAKDAAGVTYRLAVVTETGGTVTPGTVTAPAAPANTDNSIRFAGWRGFQYDGNGKASEKIYAAGETDIPVRENTVFNAVWEPVTLTVKLNLNGGTGIDGTEFSVNYNGTLNGTLPNLTSLTKDGFAFDGWKTSKRVTEDGKLFAKGSTFDPGTRITNNLELTAQWKHVHSYTCYKISDFGLTGYASYENYFHVAICGCDDVRLEAHSLDSNGVCACGYGKTPETVTLKYSYGQWAANAYTAKTAEATKSAKKGQETSVYAPDAWGELNFSKWQYSTDGSTWNDLTTSPMVSFIIPCDMFLRALYVNDTVVPQVELSARAYDDQAKVNGRTVTMDNILFQMNYKLPDSYTFVDAGIRLGDNAGISYYELKERTYTADSETKALMAGFAVLGSILSAGLETVDFSATDTFYEVHKNSVLDEMTAESLAKYMYESKPINVEKYDPIYWEAKAVTKGMSGSMATLPPLRFAQKDNQNHWIYGIGWLRYKDSGGNVKTIYTPALAATVNNIPTNTVSKSGS